MIIWSGTATLKDSLRTRELAGQVEQLEAIFETEKQNNRIGLLMRENQIQELQINRQENLKISLIILGAILLLFTMIIAYRYRAILLTNRVMKHKLGELEETNQKLRLSELGLEQLNSTKNRFFSIIAHDLKNPFNALLGFSEMIAANFNQLKEKEIREYIGIVHQSSQNLYKLLENLLKWSAAQTGTMHYLPEQFDLISLIHSEINFFRISAGKKNIDISAKLPDELIVNSDKLLLSSVIRNLIDNAIKFTDPGGSIEITATRLNKEVIVGVSDTGIGIPYEMQKKLFLIDGNIGRKGTEKEEGGGLGLILCKELIDKTGGSIGFESEPGKGSRFWFTLPLN
jgi:signal transduction histidine kinase